jgi:hypothetical protein
MKKVSRHEYYLSIIRLLNEATMLPCSEHKTLLTDIKEEIECRQLMNAEIEDTNIDKI